MSNNKATRTLLMYLLLSLVSLTFSSRASTTANNKQIASSVGQLTAEFTDKVNATSRSKYWLKNKQILRNTSPVALSPISLGIKREEYQKLKKNKTLAQNLLNVSRSNTKTNYTIRAQVNYNYHDSFSIYDAFSYLLDDIDEDGYFQSFSIVFDADFYTSSNTNYANVYAEAYLSLDGGPWTHYYTSEIFSIHGESDEDEYEIMTTLEQGFSSGYYNVLIDLYDADYNELVVSYSSDDDNALYALPLESSDIDKLYVTEVVYEHGGSTSLTIFILIVISLFIRQRKYLPQLKHPAPMTL